MAKPLLIHTAEGQLRFLTTVWGGPSELLQASQATFRDANLLREGSNENKGKVGLGGYVAFDLVGEKPAYGCKDWEDIVIQYFSEEKRKGILARQEQAETDQESNLTTEQKLRKQLKSRVPAGEETPLLEALSPIGQLGITLGDSIRFETSQSLLTAQDTVKDNDTVMKKDTVMDKQKAR